MADVGGGGPMVRLRQQCDGGDVTINSADGGCGGGCEGEASEVSGERCFPWGRSGVSQCSGSGLRV